MIYFFSHQDEINQYFAFEHEGVWKNIGMPDIGELELKQKEETDVSETVRDDL